MLKKNAEELKHFKNQEFKIIFLGAIPHLDNIKL